MDVHVGSVESMSEADLRELIDNAEKALDRLIAKRARSTLKEARRLAAEVGFEVTFSKVGKAADAKAKPQSPRGKVLPKYRNPENADETWSGRGRQPKWVQAALAEGVMLSDLAIAGGAPLEAQTQHSRYEGPDR
jgi:DNA-binding protein H-NS